jgi:hypothetical protein
MGKTKKYSLLWIIISLGFASNAMASTPVTNSLRPLERIESKNTPVTHDILSDNVDNSAVNATSSDELSSESSDENALGDNSENDSANDYDSNKQSESENAAPTPQEEEDNPLLDEDGNVTAQGQQNPAIMQMQNPVNPQSVTSMPNPGMMDDGDK